MTVNLVLLTVGLLFLAAAVWLITVGMVGWGLLDIAIVLPGLIVVGRTVWTDR